MPHGSGTSRAIEVSASVLRALVALGVSGVALALLVGLAAVSRGADAARHDELSRENERLVAELGRIETRMGMLRDTLDLIQERESRIRLLANLDPLDPDVHLAGIGGPAPSTPAEPSVSPLIDRARDTRSDLGGLIRRANLLAWSFREAAESLSYHVERLEATPSIMPTQGWLSSAFSAMREHPILHVARPHEGIDVTAEMGTPILAPGAGRVIQAGWTTGYGNTVKLDHGYGIVTIYAHASRVTVRVGQRVRRGDVIANVGRTGLAVGPHLHYEVHVNGRPVNPLRYILPAVVAD